MRRVSRVVLFDEHGRFLLFLTKTPRLAHAQARWITPGGGVESHESHHEGALRELFEETGLSLRSLIGPIHALSTVNELAGGATQNSYAEFFTHATSHFDISREYWLDYEHADIVAVKWFTAQELLDSGEDFSPANLIDIVEEARAALR